MLAFNLSFPQLSIWKRHGLQELFRRCVWKWRPPPRTNLERCWSSMDRHREYTSLLFIHSIRLFALPFTCIKPVVQATVEPLQSHETTDSVLLLYVNKLINPLFISPNIHMQNLQTDLISFKNYLREFAKRPWPFLFGDHFINSHNFISWQCMDIVRKKLMLVTIGT